MESRDQSRSPEVGLSFSESRALYEEVGLFLIPAFQRKFVTKISYDPIGRAWRHFLNQSGSWTALTFYGLPLVYIFYWASFSGCMDWDLLAACGAPLSSNGKGRCVTPEILVETLLNACEELSSSLGQVDTERKREAVQAVLLALGTHFPTFFRRHLSGTASVAALYPNTPSGRVIKLRRLALARLAEYL